jgi:two-component system LytT family response regulator
MLRAVIVDDEFNAREVIRLIMGKHIPEVEIVGEADGIVSGEALIRQHNPDLVLLDIQLTDGNGFDLLQRFDVINFQIIFVTAFEKYAIKAFKFSALEYILKPVDPADLVQAVKKAVKSVENNDINLKLNAFFNNFRQINTEAKKIILSSAENLYLINVNDMIRCQAEHNQTRVYMDNQEDFLVSKPLAEFDELLDGYRFARINKDHLINLRHALRLDPRGEDYIFMSDKSIVPVSPKKVEWLKAEITKK